MAIGVISFLTIQSGDVIYGLIPRILLGAIALSISTLGILIYKRGQKHLTATASETMARDKRLPVLYLRSFKADSMTSQPLGAPQFPVQIATEEEEIASIMNEVGPFIAIGKPGEKLPELGASRMYTSGDEWQDTVTDLMSRSQLVALRAGETRGFWWEVQQAVKLVDPQKILILIPFDEKQYEAFRRKANEYFRRPLPSYAGSRRRYGNLSLRGIVYFESDWTPRFLPFKSASLMRIREGAIRATFHTLFEKLNISYASPRPSLARRIPFLILVGLLLGLILLLLALLLF